MSDTINTMTNAEELGELVYGGTYGGDGSCEAYSRRFTWFNKDGKYIVITEYVYPVDMRARQHEDVVVVWDVEMMSEIATYESKEDYDNNVEPEYDYEYTYPFDVAIKPNTYEAAKNAAEAFTTNRLAVWMYGEPIDQSSTAKP